MADFPAAEANTPFAIRSTASFRDPSGFVYSRGGVIYRQVQPSYRADFERLIESGLYAELTRRRLLIPHEEADPSLAFDSTAASRRDVFGDYHKDGFEIAFRKHFRILRFEQVSGSQRTLYAMLGRAGST